MKPIRFTLQLLAAFCATFCCVIAFAQVPSQVSSAISPETQSLIFALLNKLQAHYPHLALYVTAMGALRVIFKPIFSLIHQLVNVTPSKWSDTIWSKVHDFLVFHPVGMILNFLLDWATSIKITPPSPNP